MRYLIDPEFRTAKLQKSARSFIPYVAELRRELSLRNLRWALDHGHAHEVSLGTVPRSPLSRERSRQPWQLPRPCLPQDQADARLEPSPRQVHTSARRALAALEQRRDPAIAIAAVQWRCYEKEAHKGVGNVRNNHFELLKSAKCGFMFERILPI
jgi:hypothetical protein